MPLQFNLLHEAHISALHHSFCYVRIVLKELLPLVSPQRRIMYRRRGCNITMDLDAYPLSCIREWALFLFFKDC